MEIQWNSVKVMLKAPSGPEHGSFLPSVHSTANFDLVQVTDTFTGEQKPFCVQTGYAAVASSLFSVGPVQSPCSQCTIYLILTNIIIALVLSLSMVYLWTTAERSTSTLIIFVDSIGHRPQSCRKSKKTACRSS